MVKTVTSTRLLRPIVAIFAFISVFLIGSAAHADHARDFDFSKITPGHELGCLALNIYHEGRGEPIKGQSAIAAVTMNRVRSEQYPDTVCEVVWQHKQFSWTTVSTKHHSVTDMKAWKQSLVIAELFLNGARVADVGNATHYHATYVTPYWTEDKTLVAQVGNHIFYIL